MDTKGHLTLFFSILVGCVLELTAQTTYVFPFVTINPSAASSGMGESGVATLPQDATSIFFNSAKLQFTNDKAGGSLSYVPYLNFADFFLIYLAGYHKIGQRQTISASFRYSNLGTLNLATQSAQSLGSVTPQQFAANLGYAVQLGRRTSLSGNFGIIHSDIFSFTTGTSQVASNRTNAIVLGLNFFWINREIEVSDWKVLPTFGLSIDDVGIANANQGYLPSNLKMGYAFQSMKDSVHRLTFAVDVGKFLVPSVDPQVQPEAFKVLYESFYDAPGGLPRRTRRGIYELGIELYLWEFFSRFGAVMCFRIRVKVRVVMLLLELA